MSGYLKEVKRRVQMHAAKMMRGSVIVTPQPPDMAALENKRAFIEQISGVPTTIEWVLEREERNAAEKRQVKEGY